MYLSLCFLYCFLIYPVFVLILLYFPSTTLQPTGKNTGQISQQYHTNITKISQNITTISQNITNISQQYHKHITKISQTYHKHITNISQKYHKNIRAPGPRPRGPLGYFCDMFLILLWYVCDIFVIFCDTLWYCCVIVCYLCLRFFWKRVTKPAHRPWIGTKLCMVKADGKISSLRRTRGANSINFDEFVWFVGFRFF